MKRSSATFGLYLTGMLITAVSLVSNSFQGILIILEVHNKEVFAQTPNDTTINLEFSYTELEF